MSHITCATGKECDHCSSGSDEAGPSWRETRKEKRDGRGRRFAKREPKLKGKAAKKHFRLMRDTAEVVEALLRAKKPASEKKL
jgi:hypothetical protein